MKQIKGMLIAAAVTLGIGAVLAIVGIVLPPSGLKNGMFMLAAVFAYIMIGAKLAVCDGLKGIIGKVMIALLIAAIILAASFGFAMETWRSIQS